MHAINVSDLLPRKERLLDPRPVRAWLAGKRVAVTGAGGFIGSELVHQLDAFGPEHMTLIDNSEYNLYQIARVVRRPHLAAFADVRDFARMRWLLAEADIVFHAAAMKHVPICEQNREEAAKTNIGGTENVIRAAHYKAQFVFVSTDKAVNPSSHMGLTKLGAEQRMRRTGRASIVRFGNVIGSTGSVVPLFQEQIARGGPVTVTDARMTRYFMTVAEAAELILQAGAAGAGTYVLDMGEPVSILTLAREMVRLSGRRDVEIVETGIRAGEKLHEQLSEEQLEATAVEGLFRVSEALAEAKRG